MRLKDRFLVGVCMCMLIFSLFSSPFWLLPSEGSSRTSLAELLTLPPANIRLRLRVASITLPQSLRPLLWLIPLPMEPTVMATDMLFPTPMEDIITKRLTGSSVRDCNVIKHNSKWNWYHRIGSAFSESTCTASYHLGRRLRSNGLKKS